MILRRRFSASVFPIFVIILSLVFVWTSCSRDSDKVIDNRTNEPPEIISPEIVEAAGEVHFIYKALVEDPDSPNLMVEFFNYPSWLTVNGDSIFGRPVDGLKDSSFIMIASDGDKADTQEVIIEMIPPLVVYGDSRSGHTIHQKIVNLICDIEPAAVFHTGDLVNDGNSVSDWNTFNTITMDMRSITNFYPALGNHEKQSSLYFDNFVLPGNEQWYSVEINEVHFIILNSCVALDVGSEQYEWLEADLQSVADSIDFTAVIFHHPPYSTGPHTEDEMGLRDLIVPLFEQYGVDIVFNGHDHCYERSFCGGVFYIVAGGGGAPLYDQTRSHPCSQFFAASYHFCKISTLNDRFIVKVLNENDEVIDRYVLDRR